MSTWTLSKHGWAAAKPWLGDHSPLRAEIPVRATAPNAVVQLITAQQASGLGATTQAALTAIGELDWTRDPPYAPVDERRVAGVHRILRLAMPPRLTSAIIARAGRLTADDLLIHRIPGIFRWLLPRLPGAVAVRLALPLITRENAAFTETGALRARIGARTVIEITDNSFCAGEHAAAPVCAWQAAAFERLLEGLMGRPAHVVETECHACGDECCRFVVVWGDKERRQRLSRRLGIPGVGDDPEVGAPPRRVSTWACIGGRQTRIPGDASLIRGPWG